MKARVSKYYDFKDLKDLKNKSLELIIRSLIKRRGPSALIDYKDDKGLNLLSIAIVDGLDEKIEELLSFDLDWFSVDNEGNSPLHHACKTQGPHIVSQVLANFREHDQSLDKINRSNISGDTPLHFVGRHRNESLINLLVLAGADLLAKNDKNQTPCDFFHSFGLVHLSQMGVFIGKVLPDALRNRLHKHSEDWLRLHKHSKNWLIDAARSDPEKVYSNLNPKEAAEFIYNLENALKQKNILMHCRAALAANPNLHQIRQVLNYYFSLVAANKQLTDMLIEKFEFDPTMPLHNLSSTSLPTELRERIPNYDRQIMLASKQIQNDFIYKLLGEDREQLALLARLVDVELGDLQKQLMDEIAENLPTALKIVNVAIALALIVLAITGAAALYVGMTKCDPYTGLVKFLAAVILGAALIMVSGSLLLYWAVEKTSALARPIAEDLTSRWVKNKKLEVTNVAHLKNINNILKDILIKLDQIKLVDDKELPIDSANIQKLQQERNALSGATKLGQTIFHLEHVKESVNTLKTNMNISGKSLTRYPSFFENLNQPNQIQEEDEIDLESGERMSLIPL